MGNTNALKHGFYCYRFSDIENHDLEVNQDDDLRSESAMLRVVFRSVFELSVDLEDLAQAWDFFRHISLAVGKLASLSRTQALYGVSAENEIQHTILQAIKEIAEELNLED